LTSLPCLLPDLTLLFLEHSHDHKTPPTPTRSSSISQPEQVVDDDVTPPRRISGRSSSHERSGSYSSMYGHPIATRASVMQAAQDIASPPSHTRRLSTASHAFDERLPLLGSETSEAPSKTVHHNGHTHGSMNMRALVLHVLGDALGNVGVIATGLVIWLTEWKYKFYFDPIISLVITVIIFSSALPLGMCILLPVSLASAHLSQSRARPLFSSKAYRRLYP
jgi:zinc transporter 1